jgi:hypothetical protein
MREEADETTVEETGRSGISRRNLIKKGTVVCAAVWVAPVIDSVVSRAAAGSAPPGNGAGCVPSGADVVMETQEPTCASVRRP